MLLRRIKGLKRGGGPNHAGHFLTRGSSALSFPNPLCVCARRPIQYVVLQCGLHVLVMKTEPHNGCFSSKGSWQANDLIDIGVTVFWSGVKLAGALTLTVSLSGESESRPDNDI